MVKKATARAKAEKLSEQDYLVGGTIVHKYMAGDLDLKQALKHPVAREILGPLGTSGRKAYAKAYKVHVERGKKPCDHL